MFGIVRDSFDKGCISPGINDSYISLIPKTLAPSTLKDFRPIELCNTMYKVLTKVISNRVKSFLTSLINPIQSSFVPGRTIEENVLVVKEVSHYFKKSKKGRNLMAFKNDLTKAYDGLE